MVTARKTIICLIVTAFFLALGLIFYLEISYSKTLPKSPDQRASRIYQMTVNHGYVVYGTLREFKLLGDTRIAFVVCAVLTLIAGLLNVKYRDFPPFSGKPRDTTREASP
jgi:hypothetical protein